MVSRERVCLSDRRSACPVVVCHFPGRAKHVVPRAAWWRAPRRMPTGPRVRDARWDFVERERHPHTCTRGQRARATATRPRRPQPTRQGEPGVAGAHKTAEARSPQHTAQQLTHTLTPTRQAAPAATTSTAAPRRLLNVRPIVLLPRRRLEPAPCALRGSASAPLLVRDAHGEQPSLHVQASHFPLARKLHALERHRRERRQGV